MSKIQEYWNTLQTEYDKEPLSDEFIVKLDELILNDEIENIRNGVMLMSTLAPAGFCRYLTLSNDSMVLSDVHAWPAPLLAERALVEAIKAEQMWLSLYETGVFNSMAFRALGNVEFDSLTDDEKDFCVRLGKEMVHILAGDFMMGALEDDEDAEDWETPRHKVTLTRDFLIGKYPVTQTLWGSVMDSNPSKFKGVTRPVEMVSWFDVLEFCNKLSKREGLESAYTINGKNVTCNWNAKGYRLPTEAEWEYAARGGEYHKYAGSNRVDEVAWCRENSDTGNGRQTHPVGQKKANGFGLYDMSGNVDEWCWNWWSDDYSTEMSMSASVENPTGIPTGFNRVYRGGSWGNDSENVRVSYRNNFHDPSYPGYGDLGFRVCRFP